jgi:hypothetical protein
MILMSTLLEQLKTKAAEVETRAAEVKRDAAQRYATLLHRFDTPKIDDADQLLELMPVLGITADDIYEDQRVVGWFRDHEAKIGEYADLRKQADEVIAAKESELAKIREELAPLNAKAAPLKARILAINDSIAEFNKGMAAEESQANLNKRHRSETIKDHPRLFPSGE